jgi:hypothetical protein
MWELSKEIILIIAALFAAAFTISPQLRNNRPWLITGVAVLLTLLITVLNYSLIANTGKGLQERAACVLFPRGASCAIVKPKPLPAPPGIGTDEIVILPEYLNFPDGKMADPLSLDDSSPTSDSINGPWMYCDGFTISNLTSEPIILESGPPESDHIEVLVGIRAGERRRIDKGDLPIGRWFILDKRRRFYFVVERTCK